MQLQKQKHSDHTEKYQDTGLDSAFLSDIANVVDALKAVDYEPYDQLIGYLRTRNKLYITRHGNAREIIKGMNKRKLKIYLSHYRNRK